MSKYNTDAKRVNEMKLIEELERMNAELRQLVGGAKPIVECWHAEQAYNVQWKKDWLVKANCVLREAKKPVAKEAAHTSCEGCIKLNTDKGDVVCLNYLSCFRKKVGKNYERNNCTSAPAPAPKELDCPICQDKSSRLECPACGGSGKLPVLDGSMLEGKTVTAPALKVADEPDASVSFYPSWMEIHTLCCDIGMKPNCNSGQDTIIAFIRSLAQRAGEDRYSVDQTKYWVSQLPMGAHATQHIDNPTNGIKAVIKRKGT
jgi:hypothetical protein